jgi:hypothetical protein
MRGKADETEYLPILELGLVPPSSLDQSDRETESLSPTLCAVRSMVGIASQTLNQGKSKRRLRAS